MVKVLQTYYERLATRHYLRVVAFAVLGLSLGALTMLLVLNAIEYHNQEKSLGDITAPLPLSTYVLEESLPISLSIPAIGVETTFETPLGLNPDRTIEVPDSYEAVGWYQHGPTPGELGPAVVLGHVDSFEGPAVFYSLGQLTLGDAIEITREDGSIANFNVTGLERYAQEGFPRELVYGDINHAGLRLVTCSGVYDRGSELYSHNLVVYAALSEEKSTENSD